MQLPAEWQASMTAELVAANDIQDGARGKLVDMAETVTLFSSSLLSKWGFNDGDWPDDVWDILDERGATDLVDHWHDVLIELVKTRLIPALDQQVVVVEMQTNHNPIRVTTVDGVDVQADWYEDRLSIERLTPEYVDVPMAEVINLLLAAADGRPDER